MEKIKPQKCPSCGHEAQLTRVYLDDLRFHNRIYGVICSNDECDNAEPSRWYDDPVDAVTHWNGNDIACPPDVLIEDLQVSERVKNALSSIGIHTVKAALHYKGSLRHMRNFGDKSYDELLNVFRDYLSGRENLTTIDNVENTTNNKKD